MTNIASKTSKEYIENVLKNFTDLNGLSFIINFTGVVVSLENMINIKPDDIKYIKDDVEKVIVIGAIENNKFSFISLLQQWVKVRRKHTGKIILIENKSMKVQGFIQESLPIFHGMGIEGVFDSVGDICRIVWRSF